MNRDYFLSKIIHKEILWFIHVIHNVQLILGKKEKNEIFINEGEA